jgi:hypothetical protein
MSMFAFFAPLIAMAALTFALMFGMVVTRRRAVLDKKVDPKDLLIRGTNPWPAQVAQFGDAYQNALELPILFYALMILIFVTRLADPIFIALAWAFVLCRFVQAYVHTTSNIRKYRSWAYRGGSLVLFAMWILFTARLVSA